MHLKACSHGEIKPSTSQHGFILLKLLTSGTQVTIIYWRTESILYLGDEYMQHHF